jgi:hypothetical protein
LETIMAVWTRGSAGWRGAFLAWLKRHLPHSSRRAPLHVNDLPDALRLDVSAPPQPLPTREDDLWERIRAAKLPPL